MSRQTTQLEVVPFPDHCGNDLHFPMLKGTPLPGLDGAKMIAGEDGSGLSELEVDSGRTAAFNLDCSCSLQMEAGGLGRNFRKKNVFNFPLLPVTSD